MDRQQRDVALVALQAAVLTRRIFLPPVRRRDLGPEQWQVLIAIALNDEACDRELPSGTVESVAAQLSLDRDDTHELLFSLRAAGHLQIVDADDLDEQELPHYALTDQAHIAIEEYLTRAARFLPGWPRSPTTAR